MICELLKYQEICTYYLRAAAPAADPCGPGPLRHHNPRWSMYRVCLSCDAKKQCFLCQIKQTKEYFSHVVWQTRDPKRRLCLQCQTKTRGSWKCAVCHQRRSRHQFSYFISRQPSGKDGTQTCDTCHAAKVQHAVRKRAAAASIARLEPLRKRIRRRHIIQETWEAIAANKKARTHDHSTDPVEMRSTDMASAGLLQASSREKTAAAEYVYACPFCKGVVTSPCATGHIDHRRICGKQFRVENGFVRPTLHYVHTCPTCGSCIHSTKQSGRIRSKHKQANGRMCPRTEWQLK